MSIPQWPLNQRPRERLINQGVQSLSNAELLAIFLQTGTKGLTALDLAQELLDLFPSFHQLLQASKQEFAAIKGIGNAKYALLQAAFELGRRYLEEDLGAGELLNSADSAINFLIAKLSHYRHEVFSCLFLTTKLKLIKYEELFFGTLTCAPVYPRVLAQKALACNAGALILAHNHPSGDVEPSQGDIRTTQHLIQVLADLEIKVIDHIIVGGNKTKSLATYQLL